MLGRIWNRSEPNQDRLSRRCIRSLALLSLFIPFIASGCQTTSNPLAEWRSALDSGLYKGLTPEENASVSGPDDSGSLLKRWLTPGKITPNSPSPTAKPSSALILGSDGWKPMVKAEKDPKADAEIAAAVALFKQGKLPDAEKAFKKIAKDRKGTAWGEKAQFFLAETQYEQQDYFHAHDSYEQLIVDYPGTEHLDKLVEREYKIAQLWLAQGDAKTKPEQKLPFSSHFNGQLPLIDTDGSALKALEHVRQHDPTGNLADDASIEIADYHMTHRDFESAAIYYDQFIGDHPKSPFLQRAQLAAIDSRMNAYLGPEYDSSGLEKARELVKKTLQTFPERQASYEKLYQTLDHINEAEAEKTYNIASYYKKTKHVASAEFYFGKIPQRWPESPWAKKAKLELAELAKMPRTQAKPVKMMTQPGSNDPFLGGGGGGMGGQGMGGMNGMGGMGMPGMGMGQGMM